MSKETYNRIVSLITFIFMMAFVMLKILGFISFSWFGILLFFVLGSAFIEYEKKDDGTIE